MDKKKNMRELKKEDLKDGLRVYCSDCETWGTIKYDKFKDIDGCEWESPYEEPEHKWNFRSDAHICGNCTWRSNVLNTLKYYLIEC